MRQCSFDGCGKPERAAGLCRGHLAQKYRGEELRPLARREHGTHRLQLVVSAECWDALGDRPAERARLVLEEWAALEADQDF